MYNERIDNLRCFRTGIQILNLDKIRLFLYFPIICLELFCFLVLFLHYYFKPASNKGNPQTEAIYSTSSSIKIIEKKVETLKGQGEKKQKQEKNYSHLPT